MHHFAEFYQRSPNGKIIPACGTDSHLPIDGRLGLARAEQEAMDHMQRIGYRYTGFALFRVRGQRTGKEHPYYTWGDYTPAT